MSAISDEAWSPVGARARKCEAIPITSASTVFDLSLRTNIYADLQAGRLVLADADGADVYYFFSSEAAADTADPANTTAGNATQCARIPTGLLVEFRPPYFSQSEINSSSGGLTNVGMARYLVARTSAGTATLRLSLAGESPDKKRGG